jgi:hypothetical protein
VTRRRTEAHSSTASKVGSEGELRRNVEGSGSVTDAPQGVGGIDVVAVGEQEEQIVGGDVVALGVDDGLVLGETDDDLELVVQRREVERRHQGSAGVVDEEGVDGVEAVGSVVVDLPLEAVAQGRVEGLDVFPEGQEERTQSGGGGVGLVDPVTVPGQASGGASGLTISGVTGDEPPGNVVAVETGGAGDVGELADATLDGEVDQGGRVGVSGVGAALLDDVVASAEVVGGVGEELLAVQASGVGARALGLVVGLAAERAGRNVEAAGGSVEGQTARVGGESGAGTGVRVESSAAQAVRDGRALASASRAVVGLASRASRNDERARGDVVGQVADVGREGRARASVGVPGRAAGAVLDAGALASASGTVVDLRVGAVGDDEGAGRNVVGQVADIGGEGRARASVGVPGGGARAGLDGGALASAGGTVVSLRAGAVGDDEGAGRNVVGQVADIGGEGRARASVGVPGRAAGAGLDVRTFASASGAVVALSGRAVRDDERTGRNVVGQVADVGRESRARASVRVPGRAARAGLNAGALASARSTIVSLRAGAGRNDERTGRNVVGQVADIGGEGRARASVGVPGRAAGAGLDVRTFASASGAVVALSGRAVRDDERTGRNVVGQVADVGRESRARASVRVPGRAAGAGLDGRAFASARSAIVSLRAGAGRNDERTSRNVVGQVADVGREGRARASVRVPSRAARASLNAGALASARSTIVSLRAGAGRNDERTGRNVVGQVADIGGEGRARASIGVPGGGARASLNAGALALTLSSVVDLRADASGDIERARSRGVGQTARVSRVGGTSAGVVVPGGGAEAVDDVAALALAGVDVVGLTSGARGDVEVAGGAVVVQ